MVDVKKRLREVVDAFNRSSTPLPESIRNARQVNEEAKREGERIRAAKDREVSGS